MSHNNGQPVTPPLRRSRWQQDTGRDRNYPPQDYYALRELEAKEQRQLKDADKEQPK